MNSVHDMGGMHGLGPVEYEPNEPVFHETWEGRAFALNLASAAWGKWSLDAFRYQVELLPATDYLRMSYYEKWFNAVSQRLVQSELITRTEIETGQPVPGSSKSIPPLTAEKVPTMLRAGAVASRQVPVTPRFQAGRQVRARNINPVGHTRLPRYARGKQGIVHRDHGVYVFPDTIAHGLGDKAQHVYSVRFTARELWGEQASPLDSVYIDLWDDYLEPA